MDARTSPLDEERLDERAGWTAAGAAWLNIVPTDNNILSLTQRFPSPSSVSQLSRMEKRRFLQTVSATLAKLHTPATINNNGPIHSSRFHLRNRRCSRYFLLEFDVSQDKKSNASTRPQEPALSIKISEGGLNARRQPIRGSRTGYRKVHFIP